MWLAALPLLMTKGWARESLDQTPLLFVGTLFGLTIAVGLASLTPLTIGVRTPLWTAIHGLAPCASIDPYSTLLELLKLFGLAAAFLVGASFGGAPERAKQLIQSLLVAGLAYGVWAFLDFKFSPTKLFGETRLFDHARLSASLGSANIAATLFGTLVLLNLADLLRSLEQQRERWPSGFRIRHIEDLSQAILVPTIGILVGGTCLILTFSRAGIVVSIAAAIILASINALIGGRDRKGLLPILGVGSIIAAVLIASAAISIDAMSARALAVKGDIAVRGAIYLAHWHAFQASPWQGHGLGTFRHINSLIMNDSNETALYNIGATHNVIIQWLEEAGLLGSLPMFAAVALIGLHIASGVFRRRRVRLWLVAIATVLLLFLLHSLTDFALEVPSMALLLSLILGLGFRLARPGLSRDPWLKGGRHSLIGAGRDQTDELATKRGVASFSEVTEGQ